MKVVTKRSGKTNHLEDIARLQRTINRLHNNRLVPRGVYRFKTFEEADQWMRHQMALTHARQNSKTSSSSAVL